MYLLSEALARIEGGGHAHSSDLGDEGQHGLHSQLCDSHDEHLAGRLEQLLQLLLAVNLQYCAAILIAGTIVTTCQALSFGKTTGKVHLEQLLQLLLAVNLQ